MKRSSGLAVLASLSMFRALPIRAQQSTAVRIGGAAFDDMTPVLYAMESGLFNRAGLDLQFQSSAVGPALAAGVIGGTLDIAKSNVLPLMTAYDRGIRFKILAGAAVYSADMPTTQVVVLKDSSFRTIADAAGKTVACTSLRGLDQLGEQVLIDKSGADSLTVKFIEVSYSTMLAALEQGRADFGLLAPPFLEAALETGKIRTIVDPYAAFGNPSLIAAWFATEAFVQRSPDVARRFAGVVRTATAYTNAHGAETISVLAKYSRMDPEVIRKMQRTPNAATAVNQSMIQPAIDLAAKYKYISRGFDAKELLYA